MSDLNYKRLSQTKNRYKFEATIPADLFEKRRNELFNQKAKSVKIAGFRPGKAPKAELEREIGYSVYIDTINKVIPEIAEQILIKESLTPISTLNYNIVEAKEDDKEVKFTFEFLSQPVINSKKLENLGIKKKSGEVEEKEIEEVIKNLIKSTLPKEKWEKFIIESSAKKTTSKKKDGKEGESVDADQTTSESEDITLSDELISELGSEDAKDLEGVKIKVRESLLGIKSEQFENEYVSALISKALEVSEFEVPHEYVHKEMDEREDQFKRRLKELKLDVESYLRTQGKTLDEVREEWHKQAEIDLSTDLLLINLAIQEKLLPTDEDLEAEVSKMDEQSKIYYKNVKNRDYLRTALLRNNGLKKLKELNSK